MEMAQRAAREEAEPQDLETLAALARAERAGTRCPPEAAWAPFCERLALSPTMRYDGSPAPGR